MSVLVIGKFQGDTEIFRRALQERGDEFAAISARSQTVGAIHHRFGIGDGFVVVIDEWESAEQFQTFFSDPELQQFISEIGAAGGPPDITFCEAASSPDEF
jgi:hypothetical protein